MRTPVIALLLAVFLPAPGPVNELTLARLRPGVDTLTRAVRVFPAGSRTKAEGEGAVSMAAWDDSCGKRLVRLELGDKGMIQGVTVSDLGEERAGCRSAAVTWATPAKLETGRGLALGQNCKRAIAIYGEPDSRGPSTQSGRDLELLYYQFDWAGTRVPQVMEVTCERPGGRVVQITLAFPSL